MKNNRSEQIFAVSQRYIPGGVNSPVRAFGSVGMSPVIAASAHGSHITDADGNCYIDYICSWGPLIFGHSPDFLLDGLTETVGKGVTYGLPTEIEYKMARFLSEAYPAAEKVRMVNSGTEATMSAIRAARGYTGRDKLVKFEGCYHGHSDALLVKSGSGTLTFGVPTSSGVPAPVVKDTLVCRYNDSAAIQRLFAEFGQEIACIIVEPIGGNMGLVPGDPAFLHTLRELCDDSGAVLIFDEVISGFRTAFGGAAELYGIRPDMVCFGKIIGSGLPVGAFGGKREIMDCVSPTGPVYQAGTLSGNPLALSLGLKGLCRLENDPDIYARLQKKGALLKAGLEDNLRKLSLPYRVVQSGSLLCLFFTERETIESYDDVKTCDTAAYAGYFRGMLERGFLLPPSQFECMFLSDAHTEAEIEQTVLANYAALKELN